MVENNIQIVPVRLIDLVGVTRLTHENMIGADREFTRLVASPSGRWLSYIFLPINLLSSGTGFKATLQGRMIGCAYLAIRERCGYAYNVLVRGEYRRRGAGTLLMNRLEEMVLENDRHWISLQVDNSNKPAQALYEKLGYRAHHPRFFGGLTNYSNLMQIAGGVELERISPYHGSQLFAQHLELERQEGEMCPSTIINDLIPTSPKPGEYYRCMVDGETVGCLQQVLRLNGIRLELVLSPEQWGDWLSPNTLRMVIPDSLNVQHFVEINLGSSAHHRALRPRFSEIGLGERTASRFVMVKRI